MEDIIVVVPLTEECLHHCGEPISLLKVICKEMLCGVSIAAYQGMEGQSELLRQRGKICLKN